MHDYSLLLDRRSFVMVKIYQPFHNPLVSKHSRQIISIFCCSFKLSELLERAFVMVLEKLFYPLYRATFLYEKLCIRIFVEEYGAYPLLHCRA